MKLNLVAKGSAVNQTKPIFLHSTLAHDNSKTGYTDSESEVLRWTEIERLPK